MTLCREAAVDAQLQPEPITLFKGMGRQTKEVLTVDNATLGEALRQVTGPLKDLHEKLSGDEGLTWLEELKKFLRKEATWDLLELITTTATPALPAFEVSTHFRVMTEEERKIAEVPIGWMGDSAKQLVENCTEPEPEVPEAILRIHKLRKNSADSPILAGLGEQATTTWAQMYEMMRRQSHGQEGDLLVNGYANIFYIPDKDGVIWAVRCFWNSDNRYWGVFVSPVTGPYTWGAGYRVVSR